MVSPIDYQTWSWWSRLMLRWQQQCLWNEKDFGLVHEGSSFKRSGVWETVILLLKYSYQCWYWALRATSHTRLTARDHYSSSTLVGGKGGSGPSLLHTALEGPTEDKCKCNMDVESTWFLHGIEWTMVHGHLDYYKKPFFGGRLNTKPGDHGTPNAHNRWLILFYHAWRPTWIDIHWNSIWLRA